MISLPDPSPDAGTRLARLISAQLAVMPSGEAEVFVVDEGNISALGRMSRRTPLNRLLPAELTTRLRTQSDSILADPSTPVDDGIADRTPSGARAQEQLSAFLGWLGSEPREWATVRWLPPSVTLSESLKDRMAALLLRTCSTSQTRLAVLPPWEGEPPLPSQLRPTPLLTPAGAEASEASTDQSPILWEAEIPASPLQDGFAFHPLRITRDGEADRYIAEIPWLSCAGASPAWPVILEIDAWEQRLLALRGEWDRDSSSVEASQVLVQALLHGNPASELALSTGYDLAMRRSHLFTAATHAAASLQLRAPSAERIALAGMAAFRALDWGSSARLLGDAVEIGSVDPEVWRLLAVLASRRSEHARAIELGSRALELGATDPYLHLLLADSYKRLGKPDARADALRLAAAGEIPLERRLEFGGLLLELQRKPEAAEVLAAVAPKLPEVEELLAEFGGLADRAGLNADSQAAWEKVLALNGKSVDAFRALGSLHLRGGRSADSEHAARGGLQLVASDPALVLTLAQALLQQHRHFEARRELKSRAADSLEPQILSTEALLEELTGSRAAPIYRKLAETHQPGSDERTRALEAGLRVAIRDEDKDALAWFREQIPQHPLLQAEPRTGDQSELASSVVIRGGRQALYQLAGGNFEPGQDRFLAAFARLVHDRAATALEPQRKDFQESFQTSMQQLSQLLASARKGEGGYQIELNLAGRDQAKGASRILENLGLRIRWKDRQAKVERILKGDRAQGQVLAAALNVDELELREAAQAGSSFAVRVPEETADLLLTEQQWLAAYGAQASPLGSFPAFLVEHPNAATLYVALCQMDLHTVNALVKAMSLKTLAEKHAGGLLLYGSSLFVSDGVLEPPGSVDAAPRWQRLIGAGANDLPGQLRGILTKDGGDLLAFYALLASLDAPRQRFFTVSPQRLEQFYKAFRETPAVRTNQSREIDQILAIDFFREIPLDGEGRLQFPGSPEIWALTKGDASSLKSIDKRARRLPRVTTPEREDQILLRLLREDYSIRGRKRSQLENFVEVARIDAAREDPLDEDSAFLLAEFAGLMRPVYPYFSAMPFLDAADFRQILTVFRGFQDSNRDASNAEAGQFHGVLFLVATASHHGTLRPADAQTIVKNFLRDFPVDLSAGRAARATLNALRELASKSPLIGQPAGPALFALVAPWLAGGKPPFMELQHSSQFWLENYAKLCDYQRIPDPAKLIALDSVLAGLVAKPGDATTAIKAIAGLLEGWPAQEAPAKGMNPHRLRAIERYQLAPLRGTFLKLQAEAQRGAKLRPDRVQRLATEMAEALSPQATLALVGVLYARFFQAEDLLIAEDPLFLRRHDFLEVTVPAGSALRRTMLETVGGADGSMLVGGFDGIARAAGTAGAQSTMEQSGVGDILLGAELCALRSTNWLALDDGALQHFALALHAAQDWVLLAATDISAREQLATATLGVVSNSRRAALLRAIARRDWTQVWDSLSIRDLLQLAVALPAALPEASPALEQARKQPPARNQLHAFGGPMDLLRGEPLPRFEALAPYEEAVARTYPMVAVSRFAEFKLYMAKHVAAEAGSATQVASSAEATLRRILRYARIASVMDWPAVLSTYRSLRAADFQQSENQEN